MNKLLCIVSLCAAAALSAGSASAGMAMSYHGKLVPVNGAKISTKVPMMIAFRLYRNAEPGETSPLWGRTAPVRFEADGSFYVELSDSSGAAVANALHESLSDAIAAAGPTNMWLSLRPNGYGELLPRKRMSGIHRAERATTASNAVRLEAPSLLAETVTAATCEIGGSLTVKESFVSGGGSVHNVIDGTKPVSIGTSSGKVLITDSFALWYNTKPGAKLGEIPFVDVMLVYGASSGYGVFSFPMAANPPSSQMPAKTSRVYCQQFLDKYYSPFIK